MDRNRSGTRQQIVIAGAGYAGLHVALRLAAWDDRHRAAVVTLVDQHPYHQAITELPGVAAGTRAAQAVRVPLAQVLEQSVTFVQARVSGFDLAARWLLTEAGPLPYTRLVLALGSRPNDFGIPGLRERALSVYLVDDAEHVWAAVSYAPLISAFGVRRLAFGVCPGCTANAERRAPRTRQCRMRLVSPIVRGNAAS